MKTPWNQRSGRESATFLAALSVLPLLPFSPPGVPPLPGPAAAFVAAAGALPRAARAADEGDDQYRLLAGLAERGMHDMVVREGEAFLRSFPRHAKADLARYRLACALFELERPAEALPHFEKLTSRDGFEHAAEAWFRLGQCRLAAGDHRGAAEAFDEVLASNADYLFAHARFLRADAAFRAGDYATAERGYAEVLERDRGGEYARDAASGIAWCAWKQGKVDEAVTRINAYLARYGRSEGQGAGGEPDPYAAELRVLLGEAHLRAGDPAEALRAFRAVKDPAQRDAAQRGEAFALADQGDHAGAARAFGELLARSPDGPFAAEAALHRGIHLLRAGDAKAAAAALAEPAAGNGAEVLYWRGQAETAAGDARAALATLERALKASPDQALRERIQIARGDALSALGRSDDAVAAYGSAGSDYALHAAAVAALNAGDSAEAARLAEELLQRFPDSEHAERTRVVLGEARFAAGDYAAAERALAGLESVDDAGLRARARSRLAWCKYLQDDREGAAAAFAALAREEAGTSEAEEALYMEGRARADVDDAAGALRAWRAYLASYPKGQKRADALAGLARVDELGAARGHVELLVRESPESPLVPQALYDLGERASAAGELAAAKAAYEALLARAPNGPLASPARYGLGWCLFQEQRYTEAARELVPIAGDFGASAALRAGSAELLVWAFGKAGEPARAAEAWRAFAGLCDDEARVFQAAKTVALALKDAGKPAEAQALLGELQGRVRSSEVAPEVALERAYLALEAKDLDLAEAQLAAARRGGEQSRVAEASFFVAEACVESGAPERAVGLYRAAAGDESPVAEHALYKLGFTELSRNDARAAEAALSELVAKHEGGELYGEALFLLGEARFRLEKYEAAAADLERLWRERPRHAVLPKALFRLGLAYAKLERWSDCDRAITTLLAQAPNFENLAEAELARGQALAALDRPRAAKAALGRVLELDGESVLAARARIELGRIARKEGDLDAALADFLKVAVLYAADEEVAEALYLAGECLQEQGKEKPALERFREAAERYGKTEYGAKARARLGQRERGACAGGLEPPPKVAAARPPVGLARGSA